MIELTLPSGLDQAASWVDGHLRGLFSGSPVRSGAFVGGQTAADEALAGLDIEGYARRRSQVWPPSDRGASKLSPYIRHGLLDLPRVHDHPAVADAGSNDRFRYRGELLWQDYSRHWYAVHGTATRRGVRHRVVPGPATRQWAREPWPREMRCVAETLDELDRDGWMVNQTRMWLASQWTNRAGAGWLDGEDVMFRQLLDGSRAANRLGWQWVVGGTRARSYSFARRQVTKRAPAFCRRCELRDDCPIRAYPGTVVGPRTDVALHGDPLQWFGPQDGPTGGDGPPPGAVWITAESLGDGDPALAAHPGLDVHFVFDEPLLRSLRLDGKRLVFLAECLIDLAERRPITTWRGRPVDVLRSVGPVATTFAPVPGFRRITTTIEPTVVQPWPWLRPPTERYLERLTSADGAFPTFRDFCRLTR